MRTDVIKRIIKSEVEFLGVDNHMQTGARAPDHTWKNLLRTRTFTAFVRPFASNYLILASTCDRKKKLSWGAGERNTDGIKEFSLISLISRRKKNLKKPLIAEFGVTLACCVSVYMVEVYLDSQTRMA